MQILPLSVSQQRDVSALLAKRAQLQQEIQEIGVRLLILGRTVIGSAGHDVDELLAAGWDLDLSNAAVGVVMKPPVVQATGPALVPDEPPDAIAVAG